MKDADAILVTNFIRMKQENYTARSRLDPRAHRRRRRRQLQRRRLAREKHRDWIDAEYCINLDGGEFERTGHERVLTAIQASEKVYADFQLESLNAGGHSSIPSTDNAIYHLANALAKIQAYSFPVKINEITRNYFLKTAELRKGSGLRRPESRRRAASQRRRRRAALRKPVLQRAAAHHLRRHDARRRPRHQRAAANGPRQH